MWIGIAQRDGTFTGRKTIEAADQSTLGTHQNLAGHNVKARRIDTRHNTPRPRGTTRLTCWCILGEPGINDERNALAPLFTRRIATYGGKRCRRSWWRIPNHSGDPESPAFNGAIGRGPKRGSEARKCPASITVEPVRPVSVGRRLRERWRHETDAGK